MEKKKKVNKKLEQQSQAYMGALSKVMHGPDTKEMVYGMLQAGDPMKTIPQTALAINEEVEGAFKKKGGKPSLDILGQAAGFLVQDLVEIGNAAGFFNLDPENEEIMTALVSNTMQPYLEKGIKDGSIDPIELQAKTEPLLTEEGRAQGLAMGAERGIDAEAGDRQVAESYRREGVLAERGRKVVSKNKGVL